jgi:ABC-type multidrug transport system fused ATPase/permease subunit
VAKRDKQKPGAFLQVMHFIKPRLKSYLLGFSVFAATEVAFYIGIPITEKFMLDAAIDKDFGRLWQCVLVTMGACACGGASFVVFMYIFAVSVVRITGIARKGTFSHALSLRVPYFEKNHSGDILSRLTNDIGTLKNSYDWPLWNFVVCLLGGAVAVVTMLVLDWRMSLVLLASSAAFTLLNKRFAKKLKAISEEIQKSYGKLTESMGNILAGFPVIKMFRLEPSMREGFEGRNRDILRLSLDRTRKEAWLGCYNSLLSWVNFGGIMVLGALLAGSKLTSFGTIVAMSNLLWNVNRMINEAGSFIGRFQGYLAGAARVMELQGEAPEPADAALRAPTPGGGLALQMRGVRFSYDGKVDALSDFSLAVPEGRTVALVGPSGGGKSTVLKLLLGFYRPCEGWISAGGADGFDPSLSALRRGMAYVPQDSFMFDATIAENIRCARPEASMEDVVRAAENANIHDFISGLERGYETVVGERGVKLSGGQRQRLAIARAFLKDAPILLLDEATSSLDSHSERLIQDSLKALGADRTVIVVAHRLSTVQDADLICVVDQGRVAESGTHGELLARGGLYRRLHDLGEAQSASANAHGIL